MSFNAPPRDLLLDAIDWLRTKIYTPPETPAHVVPHPLDDEGVAAWVCDSYVRVWQTLIGQGGESARTTHARILAWLRVTIEAVVAGQPLPPDPRPALWPARPLHVSEQFLVDDTGRRVALCGVSLFDAFPVYAQGGSIRSRLEEAIALLGTPLKVRTFRYAANRNAFALAPSTAPDRLDAAVNFCRVLADVGCYASFTAGDAREVLPDAGAFFNEARIFYAAVREEPNALFQVQNEPFQNLPASVSIEDLLRFRLPRVPDGALTSSGFYATYAPKTLPGWGDPSVGGQFPGYDYLAVHSNRDGFGVEPQSIMMPKGIWDPAHQPYEFLRVPIDDEEPGGFHELPEPGRRSNRPYDARRLAFSRGAWHVGATLHTTAGTKWAAFGPRTTACGQEFALGWREAREGVA